MTEVVSQDLLFTRLPPNFIQVHKKAHQMLHSKGSVRVLDPPRRQNLRFWSKSTATKGQTPFSVAQAKRFQLAFSGTTPSPPRILSSPPPAPAARPPGGLGDPGAPRAARSAPSAGSAIQLLYYYSGPRGEPFGGPGD